ncbi:MAG: sulfotransferase domain-containing protein, partial [Alphaproteobacteria bacterium]
MRACILSSYPRSGNTWARFVVATAVLGRRPASAELDRLTPDAHKPIAPPQDWLPSPGLLLKSHFTPGNLAKYMQGLARGVAGLVRFDGMSVVHIVRNPFDVARSVARFYETEAAAFPAFFRRFVEPAPRFPDAFVKWGFSSWHGSGVGWLAQARTADPPVTIVRYEDLVARPEAGFARIFEAFGVEERMPLDEALELCAPSAL